jgi:hypothetical protein
MSRAAVVIAALFMVASATARGPPAFVDLSKVSKVRPDKWQLGFPGNDAAASAGGGLLGGFQCNIAYHNNAPVMLGSVVST